MRRSVVYEECGAYSFLQTCSYLIKSLFQFTVLQKLHIQSTLTCAREGTYVRSTGLNATLKQIKINKPHFLL